MQISMLPLLGFLLFTAGCGGSCVGRGVALYGDRNYIEAAEAFERTQNRLGSMQPVERVRYGLYRGLTLVALGDLRGGGRWLDYADTQERAQPSLLPVEERELLARGRIELAQKLQGSWPRPEPGWTHGVAAAKADSAEDATHD